MSINYAKTKVDYEELVLRNTLVDYFVLTPVHGPWL